MWVLMSVSGEPQFLFLFCAHHGIARRLRRQGEPLVLRDQALVERGLGFEAGLELRVDQHLQF